MPARAKPKSTLQGVDWPTEPFVVTTLPLSPSVNGSYKTNGNAQFYASEDLKQFKQDAPIALYLDRRSWDWDTICAINASKVKIPLTLVMDFYFKTPWLRDLSGPIKATEDALFEYIGLNDRLVVDLHAEKFVDKENPRCEISLYVCTERL